ncbi:katanin p80 WD40 repeat-containing subunit B1-like isoform X2 [Temnothorax longispinosus]
MPKPKVKEQWAAIVWKSKNSEKINKKGEASLCDIVDLTCVPKKYRTEGCIASLKWVDTSTDKTSYHKAEVLKISITETNIRFFETVVTAMKSTYIPENIEASKESSFKISDFYTSPGKGKVEIYPGTNFYFSEGIKANIMDKSIVLELVNHWPLLVRHALIEVYKKNLALFCTKGSKKDERPDIDAHFYKALYYLKAAVESAVAINDLAVIVDLLGILTLKPMWNLDLCNSLLGPISDLFQSKYEMYIIVACAVLRLILRNFAPVIKSSDKDNDC